MSPFELSTGHHPLTPNEVAKAVSRGRRPVAYKFARSKQELLEEAQDSLAKVA